MNYFGVPFKVNIETGKITRTEYQQDNMCFEYGYPKRQVIGAGQHSDPTANQAIGNLSRPYGSTLGSSAVEGIYRKVAKAERRRGDHGVFMGVKL